MSASTQVTGKQGASSPPPNSVGSKLKSRLSFLFARSPQQQQHQQQQAGAANVERGKNNSGKNKKRDEAKQDEPDTSEGSAIDYRPSARALQPAKANLRRHYPKIEPFETGFLDVDHHSIYWEQSGKRDGYPVVFLHGGPGGGCSSDDRRWFDPAHYRIVLFDQRGAGRSTPHSNLEKNTTWDLVGDIERLREKLGVTKWHVFGGSWGSTLALAYAQKHAESVSALVLRGIFTLRKSELLWFYQEGASNLFPEMDEPYRAAIPAEEQGDLMKAYYSRLTSDDEKVQLAAAKAWTTWEMATSKLYVDEASVKRGEDEKFALAFARIECHYFNNAGWLEDGQLLRKDNVDRIRNIPAVIVQGRYDMPCPAKTAYELHKQWPEAHFHLVPDAGHGSAEPGIMDRLIAATDRFRSIK
ncbi:putative proline iminopeptidase [Acaromyces ingoldii]|uniref:Proline iminopeptidase n=1 Tax=Acaromyces ingoldii TaxID=215250 RepID=A0A316YTE0_9BASI|nr:putative proline iminopeptidase [Acaromyces ingoldii]PWN92306.1 putative proline iminopeptidase [Acaromyces ingoldii]